MWKMAVKSANSVQSKMGCGEKSLPPSAIRGWPALRCPFVLQIAILLSALLIFGGLWIYRESRVPKSWNYDDQHVSPGPSLRARFNLDHPDLPTTSTRQSDLFISVKTSQKFHNSRLQVILQTWFMLAKSETWFFSDHTDEKISHETSKYFVGFFHNIL